MDNLYNQKIINAKDVFNDRYLDYKTLYLYYFNILSSLNFLSNVDGEKMFEALKTKDHVIIKNVHRYQWFDHPQKNFRFDKTVIVLNNSCLIELDSNYCMILHDNNHHEFVKEIV